MILRMCGKTDRLVRYEQVEHHNTLNKETDATRAKETWMAKARNARMPFESAFSQCSSKT